MKKRKRTSLDAVLGTGAAEPAPAEEAPAPEELRPAAQPKPRRSRAGKSDTASDKPHIKQHTAYLPLAVHEQLRKLAFEEDRKIHSYLLEGLDRVFSERGLPSIDELQDR